MIGTLEPVDPRSIWLGEAGDFTPSLRDNVERISVVLGISFDTVNSADPGQLLGGAMSAHQRFQPLVFLRG